MRTPSTEQLDQIRAVEYLDQIPAASMAQLDQIDSASMEQLNQIPATSMEQLDQTPPRLWSS